MKKPTADEVEMAETARMARSMRRLCNSNYSTQRIRRALYHALLMSNSIANDNCALIRQALELP